MYEIGDKVMVIEDLDDYVGRDMDGIEVVGEMHLFVGKIVTIADRRNYVNGNGERAYYYTIAEDRDGWNWPELAFTVKEEKPVDYYLIILKDKKPIAFKVEDLIGATKIAGRSVISKNQPSTRFL